MEFQVNIYIDRWKTSRIWGFTKTETGWYFNYKMLSDNCDPQGNPGVKRAFNHDNISYPNSFGNYLEYLWEQSELSDKELQEKLQQLADWVSVCERSQPKWIGWNQ